MTAPTWLVTHGAAAVLAALASFWFTDLYHSDKAAQLQATAEHERAEAFRWVAAEQNRGAAEMALADTNALTEVKRQNEELLGCIERGAGCGLRVKVVRPAACVPEADTATGVGDRGGEWAELDTDARRDYLALRARLPVVEQALRLCVDRYPK